MDALRQIHDGAVALGAVCNGDCEQVSSRPRRHAPHTATHVRPLMRARALSLALATKGLYN